MRTHQGKRPYMAEMPNPQEKKREKDVKKDRNPRVQHTLNVQLAVKQTTEQNSVGKAQVRIYVPRGTDQEKNNPPDPETKNPLITMANSQLPLQVNLSPRSLIQKTKFASTPNACTHVRKTINLY